MGERHHVADANRGTRLFDPVTVDPDMPLSGLLLRYPARFAKARMPKPFVDPNLLAQH
jgi:hypothetical protein